MFNTGLLTEICKEPLQFNNKKANNLIFYWGKDFNRLFTKEDRQTPNKYMQRCLTQLVLREMQNKTTTK